MFLFVVLLVGVALVLRPFVTAILFGGIIVIATWPAHEWLVRKGVSNALESHSSSPSLRLHSLLCRPSTRVSSWPMTASQSRLCAA